jgi:DNA-binding LytR/AlgR family response regulator
VSAYDSAAVDAFELRALDYLRKPVGRRRLEEAVERVVAAVDAAAREPAANGHGRPGAAPGAGAGAAESGMVAVANVATGATRLIARSSILYVQSHGDFVRIVTPEGRYLIRATLAEVERRWDQHGFVRVHRQYLANLARAVELRPLLGGTAELAFADGQTVPIARRHVAELGKRLGM